jgi:hypothetical protein
MARITNRFCIEYWHLKGEKDGTKVLRRINSNGTLVSTKKYSEVLFFNTLREAMPTAKSILEKGGYDLKIRYCNLLNEDNFYLS